MKGYDCHKAEYWRFHRIIRIKLTVQLKGAILVRRVRGTLHQNLPKCYGQLEITHNIYKSENIEKSQSLQFHK